MSYPPPLSRRASGNCLSSVGCGVSYDGPTHVYLADGEVADAEGSSRVVSVDAEHDALDPDVAPTCARVLVAAGIRRFQTG